MEYHIDFTPEKPMNAEGRSSDSLNSDYGESSSKIWSVYVNECQKQDKALVESWKGDMDGILIFAGLFSAVITAFLIESLQLLQLDTGNATVLLLQRISLQLDASNGSHVTIPPIPSVHNPPATGASLRVNALWCLSLLLSLLCALCATLIQQWARHYIQAVERRSAPHQRARIRAFLFRGIEKSGVFLVVDAVPAVLHVSVFLFMAGMYDYIATSNKTVAYLTVSVLCLYGALYIVLSWLPIRSYHSPFRTPFSAAMWHIKQWIKPLHFRDFDSAHITVRKVDFARGREAYAMRSSLGAEARDVYALSTTLGSLSEHDEFEPFIEGVPGFLSSSKVRNAQLIMHDLLTNHRLGDRICQLLETCTGAVAMLKVQRRKRALIGLNALTALTRGWNPPNSLHTWSLTFGPKAFGVVSGLRENVDFTIALYAHCTSATILSRLFTEYHELSRYAVHKLSGISHAHEGVADPFTIRPSEYNTLEDVRNYLRTLRSDTLSPWLKAMISVIRELSSSSNSAEGLEQTHLLLLTTTWENQHGKIEWTRFNQDRMMSELHQGRLSVLTPISQYLSLHSQSLLRLIHDEATIQSSRDLLFETLAHWSLPYTSVMIARIAVTGNIANLAQLVSAALKPQLSASEHDAVLNTIRLVTTSIVAMPGVREQRAQATLVALLRFLKNEHAAATSESRSTRFVTQLAEILVPFIVRTVDDPTFSQDERAVLWEYLKACSEDVEDLVTRAIDALDQKKTAQKPQAMTNPNPTPAPRARIASTAHTSPNAAPPQLPRSDNRLLPPIVVQEPPAPRFTEMNPLGFWSPEIFPSYPEEPPAERRASRIALEPRPVRNEYQRETFRTLPPVRPPDSTKYIDSCVLELPPAPSAPPEQAESTALVIHPGDLSSLWRGPPPRPQRTRVGVLINSGSLSPVIEEPEPAPFLMLRLPSSPVAGSLGVPSASTARAQSSDVFLTPLPSPMSARPQSQSTYRSAGSAAHQPPGAFQSGYLGTSETGDTTAGRTERSSGFRERVGDPVRSATIPIRRGTNALRTGIIMVTSTMRLLLGRG